MLAAVGIVEEWNSSPSFSSRGRPRAFSRKGADQWDRRLFERVLLVHALL